MSKETIKMRTLRLERISLKNSLRQSEANVRTQREVIGTAWPHRDTNEEAFKTIKKCGRIIKREKERLKVYRGLLRSTKDAIRKLNRQHDMRNNAVNYYILHQMKVEE
jgi:hypothetical protein